MPVLETLGGALFGAVLQVLFDRLDSRQVLDYFCGRKLDEKLLRKLKVHDDDAQVQKFRHPLREGYSVSRRHGALFEIDLYTEAKTGALDVNMAAADEYDKSCFSNLPSITPLDSPVDVAQDLFPRFFDVDLNNDSSISAKENDHFSDEMNEVSPTAISVAANEHIEPSSYQLNDVAVASPLKVDVNVHSKKTKCLNELNQGSSNKREAVVNQQPNETNLTLKYLKKKIKIEKC
ncbi:hypothetical protein Fmac_025316 [Flemingia macrophylla]|uniref:Uncharacterized protein n=1 Tax=Flemingia macrophylla TaxID=520843 RepID=A0ABD1LRZ1_9FABA